MKKVLFVTGISGFLTQFELNDVSILKDMGYEIHYASNFGKPVYELKDEALRDFDVKPHHVSIQKSPLKIKENIWAYNELVRIIEREKIDIVHCHNPVAGVIARLAAFKSANKPYTIYTSHGFHFFKGAPQHYWAMFYTAEKFAAHMTDMIITINHEDQERAEKFKLKKNGFVTRIHSVGLKSEGFRKKDAIREEMRRLFGISENTFHLISVGELNKNKNHEVVIKAISKMPEADIRYTICGEGPNREYLEKLIKKLKLENKVNLAGYRNDVEKVLQSGDAFAFPSIREGMGMAALEAMAAGLPVVAADNRGTREYMEDGVNGYICGCSDVEGFRENIEKLYSDRQLAINLGNAAVKTSKRFDIGTVDGKMRELYKIADRRAFSISNNERVLEGVSIGSAISNKVNTRAGLQQY